MSQLLFDNTFGSLDKLATDMLGNVVRNPLYFLPFFFISCIFINIHEYTN